MPTKMIVKCRHIFRRFAIHQSTQFNVKEASKSRSISFFTLIVGLVAGFFLTQIFSSIATSQIMYPCVSQKSLQDHSGSEHTSFHLEYIADNTTLADQLKKEVRILCWIMTNPKYHKIRARHVKRTWGKHCNTLLFISSGEDSELPTVKLDFDDGNQFKAAFKYVYKHYYNDTDWFYKADDDTYAVIENLRYMLYPYNPQTPVHFGLKFRPSVKRGLLSGRAGYVLSREALRRLVEEGLPNIKLCLNGTVVSEDKEIERCMEILSVKAGDSRDSMGRSRLFQFMPQLFRPSARKRSKEYVYWSYQYYMNDDGPNCCSDLAISWHNADPILMYMMDYYVYHLRPYGLLRKQEPLPSKLKVGELLPAQVDSPTINNEDRLINAFAIANHY